MWIKKVKYTVPWAYVTNDVNGEEIVGIFYKKELQKKKNRPKKIRFENVIKRKGKKLYVKTKRLQLVFLTVGLIGKT